MIHAMTSDPAGGAVLGGAVLGGAVAMEEPPLSDGEIEGIGEAEEDAPPVAKLEAVFVSLAEGWIGVLKPRGCDRGRP
jgi:uncharacterized protein (DUF1501 family)